jgi:hypothetical protein
LAERTDTLNRNLQLDDGVTLRKSGGITDEELQCPESGRRMAIYRVPKGVVAGRTKQSGVLEDETLGAEQRVTVLATDKGETFRTPFEVVFDFCGCSRLFSTEERDGYPYPFVE